MGFNSGFKGLRSKLDEVTGGSRILYSLPHIIKSTK